MRKMFVLFGVLAMVGILFIACDGQQDLTGPEEADFGKKKPPPECTDAAILAAWGDLENTIKYQYLNNKAEKGALENVENMARNICRDPQDLAAARATYFKFEIEVNKQNVNKLQDGEAGRQEILAKARAFVSVVPYDAGFKIPPEALLPTGGVGTVFPGTNDTIWTNNDEAAFVADEGSFLGTDPVTVVLTRLTDPAPGTPDYPIPGYQAYPEAYDFSASVPLYGTAEFWMCVITDNLPVAFENLVIGHDLGDGESELLPRLVEAFPGQVIDCANAQYELVGDALAAAPGWLRLAGLVLEPVVERVLDVQPLNAMYFAGKGLGGRGGALSPFAPVDAGELFTFACGVTGNGEVSGNDQSTCFFTADIDINTGTGLASSGAALTQFPAGTDVTVTATPGTGYYLDSITGCDEGDGILDDCIVTMTADRDVSATFKILDTSPYLLALGGTGTGNYGGQILGYVNPNPSSPPTTPSFTCSIGPESTCTAASIAAGAYVQLTASPDVASTFHGWGDDCFAATGTDCWLWMLEDKSATANFSEVVSAGYNLDLDVGPNGSATTSRGDGPCGPSEFCSYSYSSFGSGEIFTITAAPDPGYVATWDASCTAPARNSCSLIPQASMSAYLDFELQQVTLTIGFDSRSAGGTVTSTDGFIHCTIPAATGDVCSYTYDYGTQVSLFAEPDGTHPFPFFGGASQLPWVCSGATCTATFTMEGSIVDGGFGWFGF